MTTTNNASPMTEVPQGWNFSASLWADIYGYPNAKAEASERSEV